MDQATYGDLVAAAGEALDALRSQGPDPLFEALRKWRLEEASSNSVPAFVVFHDRTLREIVRRRPQTSRELLACHGVGSTRLERYGEAVLDVIAGHPRPPASSTIVAPQCESILELIAAGRSLTHIRISLSLGPTGIADCLRSAFRELGIADDDRVGPRPTGGLVGAFPPDSGGYPAQRATQSATRSEGATRPSRGPNLVWVTSDGRFFHATRTCRALVAAQRRARADGVYDDVPHHVVRARAESAAHIPCESCFA